MAKSSLSLSPALYTYLLKNSLREPAILQQLREENLSRSQFKMQISPEIGQFLGLLVELLGARKALEIGVFTGYSTLWVALALPDDGKIIACDINLEWTKIAQNYWNLAGVEQKIDLRIAPALETLNTLLTQGEANSFDFIFIDADKSNYPVYYQHALQLVRPGGLIVIDNVLFHGKVVDKSFKQAFIQGILTLNSQLLIDERVTISMLPIGDGLTLARKRI